ncbi:MAG: SagB/ThcOx family dehydrogenase [Candidatus Adlerbacteria bacterium]|nr:SagB/ThcOx family dehydrogenase [Candidatus Adlerbacteria bacterium]
MPALMYRLFNYFHKETKDKTEGGLVYIPSDNSLWPKSWTTVVYKQIERAGHIILKPHTPTAADFYTVASSRKSPETFTRGTITLDQLASFLQLSYGENNTGSAARRLVPSGGARYPLELYVLALNIEGLEPGVYHYNIKNHQLEHYFWKDFSPEDISKYTSYSWAGTGNALIVMTAVFNRTTQKYGSRGYRYMLLEAGHVGQMMCMAARYLGFNTRPLSGTRDEDIEKLLDVDTTRESLVYCMGVGT